MPNIQQKEYNTKTQTTTKSKGKDM